jgi:acyl carrier protein
MLDDEGIRSAIDDAILEVVKASGAAKKATNKGLFVEPQMQLDKDFGLDSLDILELVNALENRFDIEVSDDIFETVNTVGDLYKYVSITLAQKN